MRVFLVVLLLLATSVNGQIPPPIAGRCSRFEEGRILIRRYFLYYWGVCHEQLIYRCGNRPNEPKESRDFCLHTM
ncbi:unnamed protein product [Caenorhabditis angaria]|uniref:BPTI/Kunitz inhibitor domain-containing protein n=1 Tax=Caenorhabditis angaria TaxID=860376 RepID=A0A9P1MXD9_9PELO|nr:unnamed protein product [Caenorhabditis angaria]